MNISEALNEDLKSYPSLADFFARSLKEGVRHVDYDSCLVSPCDGTVLHFGTVDSEQIEQVRICFDFIVTISVSHKIESTKKEN